MITNKVHLVAFSPCGGTEKAGKALIRDIDLPVVVHACTKPEDRKTRKEFSVNDLVFFAFPVYGGRLPLNASNIFENLQGNDTPCVLVAVYGNRAFEGALLDLHKLAIENGFKPVTAVAAIAEHSMAPQIANGRPDVKDSAMLAEFGRKSLDLANQEYSLSQIPGAYPQWEMPEGTYFFPVTDQDKCVSCGICFKSCPTGAIDRDNPARTDIQKCIVCSACVKFCPNNARAMGNEETRMKFKPHLQMAASVRREPELFC